jgi:hypothetical protein
MHAKNRSNCFERIYSAKESVIYTTTGYKDLTYIQFLFLQYLYKNIWRKQYSPR